MSFSTQAIVLNGVKAEVTALSKTKDNSTLAVGYVIISIWKPLEVQIKDTRMDP